MRRKEIIEESQPMLKIATGAIEPFLESVEPFEKTSIESLNKPPPVFLARQPIFHQKDWQHMLQEDQAAAFSWFQKTARQSGGKEVATALNMLGRCYEHGWGVASDVAQAFFCYSQAAEQGDIWALFNLADCYRKGLGCVPDAKRAVELYAKAASKGHVKSLNMLGLAYEEGEGVEQNMHRAAEYFAQGAKKGDCWACLNHARFLAARGEYRQCLYWLEFSLEKQTGDYCQTFAKLFGTATDNKLRLLAARAKTIAQETKAIL